MIECSSNLVKTKSKFLPQTKGTASSTKLLRSQRKK